MGSLVTDLSFRLVPRVEVQDPDTFHRLEALTPKQHFLILFLLFRILTFYVSHVFVFFLFLLQGLNHDLIFPNLLVHLLVLLLLLTDLEAFLSYQELQIGFLLLALVQRLLIFLDFQFDLLDIAFFQNQGFVEGLALLLGVGIVPDAFVVRFLVIRINPEEILELAEFF